MNSGRPLIIWSLLLVAWIGLRVGLNSGEKQVLASSENSRKDKLAGAVGQNNEDMVELLSDGSRKSSRLSMANEAVRDGRTNVPVRAFFPERPLFEQLAVMPFLQESEGESGFSPPKTPSLNTALSAPNRPFAVTPSPFPKPFLIGNPERDDDRNDIEDRRFGVYGYSFWRPGQASDSALAAAGQYGSSQTGIIATYKINSGRKSQFSLLGRAVLTPGNGLPGTPREGELAAGVRWQPLAKIPISLSAEHRFRFSSSDATAFYLAASQDNVPLPAEFKLDAYVQAGIAHQDGSGDSFTTAFVDASAKVRRNILNPGSARVSLGGAAWAGGQSGAKRFDMGPTVTADIETAKTRLNISVDWRFRVAGDAAPGDGPAVTVSTGF